MIELGDFLGRRRRMRARWSRLADVSTASNGTGIDGPGHAPQDRNSGTNDPAGRGILKRRALLARGKTYLAVGVIALPFSLKDCGGPDTHVITVDSFCKYALELKARGKDWRPSRLDTVLSKQLLMAAHDYAIKHCPGYWPAPAPVAAPTILPPL